VKQEAFFRKLLLNKSTSVVDNTRGQAVIEYILLLVIIISLVMGMRGVFGAMNTFMSEIVGGYVSCLMEYGELPSLGVEEADLKQHKDGAVKRCPYPTFSAATAFGATGVSGSGGTGTSGSGGGGGSGVGSKGKDSGKSAGNSGSGSSGSGSGSGDKAENGSGSGSGGSSRGNRGRNSSPYSRGQVNRAGSGSSTADNPKDLNNNAKIKSIDEAGGQSEELGDGYGGRRSSRRGAGERSKYKALSGKMAEMLDKGNRVSRKPGSTLLATEEGYRLTALKRTINPPEAKAKVEEQKDESFGFGNFMKWIIIAGILIACFILFGGQVMNYSNSDS